MQTACILGTDFVVAEGTRICSEKSPWCSGTAIYWGCTHLYMSYLCLDTSYDVLSCLFATIIW